jgi:hypothetical protein
MAEQDEKKDSVRYCVTAVIDLLGFSSHLEIASNDVRTNIGREAINRLQTLEKAIELMEAERSVSPESYPATYHYVRINDAIIITVDLSDFLKPSIGQSAKDGLSGNDIQQHFDLEKLDTFEEFMHAYRAKLYDEVSGLMRFIGLVARLHSFINQTENSSYFPGARTIVSSGYRIPFYTKNAEDFLSANFSFSNAYLAEKKLHGPFFFIEDSIIKNLCANLPTRNLFRFACYIPGPTIFNPLTSIDEDLDDRHEKTLTTPVEVELFRKPFIFRRLDPHPLSYLQVVFRLKPYLDGEKIPPETENIFGALLWRMVKSISIVPDANLEEHYLKGCGVPHLSINEDIRVTLETIELGESPTLNKQQQDVIKRFTDALTDTKT